MSKILKVNGQEIICDKCIKGTDYVYPIDTNGNIIIKFKGISDFSGYVLTDDTGVIINFDTPEPTIADLQTEHYNLITQLVDKGVL